MNINVKSFQLFMVGILFIYFLIANRYNCPCNIPDSKIKDVCYRYEVFGVQLNHLYFYIFLGYFFPEYFITLQGLGILWEIIEVYLDRNDDFVIKNNLGGCLKTIETDNPHIVSKNHNKYINPLDRLFGIKNSKIHGWHGSVAEIVVNIIGFKIGSYLSKVKI